jgi:hypothetical protein
MGRLGIIIDRSKDRLSEHAQRLLKAQEEADHHPRNAHNVKPRGIAVPMAQYPDTCTECGQIYWSTDPYASHLHCPGSPPKQKAGFTL